MTLLLTLVLFWGVNLYFLKDSPNLLVRLAPEVKTGQAILYYSFAGADWDTIILQKTGTVFEVVITPPETLLLIGLYFVYDDAQIDDNNGELYLYEVKRSPRMLMPFSLGDLEVMLKQVRKKIAQQRHLDEAITLLSYITKILEIMPYIKNSNLDLRRGILTAEANELRKAIFGLKP